mgnify:CR=1 FL=1
MLEFFQQKKNIENAQKFIDTIRVFGECLNADDVMLRLELSLDFYKKNSFFFSPFRIIHPNENIIIIIHLANNDDEDWQSYLVADDLKNSPSSLSYYLKRPLLVK